MNARLLAVTALVAASFSTRGATAQTLAERVRDAGDGAVTFRYAARPGACGNGRDFVRLGENTYMGTFRRGDEARTCDEGTAIVVLRSGAGGAQALRVSVGRPDAPADEGARDLGEVPAPQAVAFLLDVAGRATSGSVADGAMLGAAVADGGEHQAITRRLLAIARDSSRSRPVRRSAMSWLARYAAAAVAGRPGDIARADEHPRDDEGSLKRHAVFVLSQQRNGAGVPALLEIASTHAEADVRAHALFWLGQSGDPRALALFDRLLRG